MFHPLPPYPEALPELFTNPFDYVPHPLVEVAREHLCTYLGQQEQWHEEINQGKMFGVLVVEDDSHNLGFLAAFSGYLAKQTLHSYFVPPILNLLEPNGFFRVEEANISHINHQIETLDTSQHYAEACSSLASIMEQEQEEVEQLRGEYLASRKRRQQLREEGCDSAMLEALGAESQRQKGSLCRCELRFRTLRAPLERTLEEHRTLRASLAEERQKRSAALQHLTFSRFAPLCAEGHSKDLISIFKEYNDTTPPAGSGECAAPKLLHYAFSNSLRPIAMGEFWWGESTRGEVRRHLQYYPACRGKCHPILSHMLRGLRVEPAHNPPKEESLAERLTVIYEDDLLIAFNKPSGLPSVRGINHTLSVQSIVESRYTDLDPNHIIVHRLDMDTSGVLIVAKSAEVQLSLQRQFAEHSIRKRYVALLDGTLEQSSGFVELPLIMDPLDRPRQRVDLKAGKAAYTAYNTLSVEGPFTRVALYPQTGRTHQLRVHCAHHKGLNTPIVGDRLYGTSAKRLMLHAEQITLLHPATSRKFTLRCATPF